MLPEQNKLLGNLMGVAKKLIQRIYDEKSKKSSENSKEIDSKEYFDIYVRIQGANQ
jgi:hypothetical protein